MLPFFSTVFTFFGIRHSTRSRVEDWWNRYPIYCGYISSLDITVIPHFITFYKNELIFFFKHQQQKYLTNIKYCSLSKIHLILSLGKKMMNGWGYNNKFYFKSEMPRKLNTMSHWIRSKCRLFWVTACFLCSVRWRVFYNSREGSYLHTVHMRMLATPM